MKHSWTVPTGSRVELAIYYIPPEYAYLMCSNQIIYSWTFQILSCRCTGWFCPLCDSTVTYTDKSLELTWYQKIKDMFIWPGTGWPVIHGSVFLDLVKSDLSTVHCPVYACTVAYTGQVTLYKVRTRKSRTCLSGQVQGDKLNMAVFFWYLVKCPVYATVHAYTGQVTFSKVPENHGKGIRKTHNLNSRSNNIRR